MFNYLVPIPLRGAYFGEGKGVVRSVDCRGYEQKLTECYIGGAGNVNYHHGRDAGVRCLCKMFSDIKP